MNELLRSLHLIWKYLFNPNSKFPTACEHDILYVCNVNLENIPVEEIHQLASWGFYPGSDEDVYYDENDNEIEIDFDNITQEDWDKIKYELTDCFRSYRFGSC